MHSISTQGFMSGLGMEFLIKFLLHLPKTTILCCLNAILMLILFGFTNSTTSLLSFPQSRGLISHMKPFCPQKYGLCIQSQPRVSCQGVICDAQKNVLLKPCLDFLTNQKGTISNRWMALWRMAFVWYQV